MADRFDTLSSGLEAPASHAFGVTPNDGTDLPEVTRALYVGGAGDVAVITKQGDTVTFHGLPAGSILPVRLSRVLATGTTATNIVGVS